MNDDMQRFVEAQARVIDRVRQELKAGAKKSHWIWFIFPQIAGLGRSEMARFFAIGSLDEARSYAGHPVLGARLRECTRLVLAVQGKDAHAIFGSPDDLKFHASMTLFARAMGEPLFRQALDKYFDGEEHRATLERI